MKKRRILSMFAAAAIALSCIIIPKSDNTGFDVTASAAAYDNVKTDGGLSIKKIVRNGKEVPLTGGTERVMEEDTITLGIDIPQVDIDVEHVVLNIKYNTDILDLTKWYKNHSSSDPERAATDGKPALSSTGWEDIWTVFSATNGSATYDRSHGWIRAEIGAQTGILYSGLKDTGLQLEATFTVNSSLGDNYGDKELFELVLTGGEKTDIYFMDQDDIYDVHDDDAKHITVWKPAGNTTVTAKVTEKERIVSFTVYTTDPKATAPRAMTNRDIVVYKRDAAGKKLDPAEKDTIDLYGVDKNDYDFDNPGSSLEYNLGNVYFTQYITPGNIERALENIDTNPFTVITNPTGEPPLVTGADHYFMLDLKQWCKYANYTANGTNYSDIHYYDNFGFQKPIVITESGNTATANPNKIYLWLYGDVDHDGQIKATDATYILKYLVGMAQTYIGNKNDPDEAKRIAREIADVTGDGEVNSRDATQILRKIVGLPSVFDNHPKPNP